MPKRRWLFAGFLCICILLIIKIPLYHRLNVTKPGGRTQETMGLPLSVICYVAKTSPQLVDVKLIKELQL